MDVRNRYLRATALAFCALLTIAPLSACGDENSAKVVFTTGLGEDEVFRSEEHTSELQSR